MQHMAEEKVTALKAELERTEHQNLEQIEALAEQVFWRVIIVEFKTYNLNGIFYFIISFC